MFGEPAQYLYKQSTVEYLLKLLVVFKISCYVKIVAFKHKTFTKQVFNCGLFIQIMCWFSEHKIITTKQIKYLSIVIRNKISKYICINKCDKLAIMNL
jgi:hypothetical protein